MLFVNWQQLESLIHHGYIIIYFIAKHINVKINHPCFNLIQGVYRVFGMYIEQQQLNFINHKLYVYLGLLVQRIVPNVFLNSLVCITSFRVWNSVSPSVRLSDIMVPLIIMWLNMARTRSRCVLLKQYASRTPV